MVKATLPDLETVYTISASQQGRQRDVSLKANEWNVMALVDGHRSLEQVCKLAPCKREAALRLLAHLKLAGIITKTDRMPGAPSPGLDKMVQSLAGLFEDYLSAKSPTPAKTVNRLAERKINIKAVEEAD